LTPDPTAFRIKLVPKTARLQFKAPRIRQIQREPAMAETVANQLRVGIIAGDFPPGARMRQEDLAERLNVSRGPVRQALVILEREGLVRADRWRGAVVTPLDVPLIRDLYEFRGAVERYVAETLAAGNGFDAAPVRDIIRLGKAAVKAGDLNRLMDLDLRFHTRLYDMVGNRVLAEVMGSQWTHTRRVRAATLKLAGFSPTGWAEPECFVVAMVAGDVPLAGRRAAAHIAAASTRMVETFSRELERHQQLAATAPRDAQPSSRQRATARRGSARAATAAKRRAARPA
jgi:DNA-binding GntR family transcriptional regulator